MDDDGFPAPPASSDSRPKGPPVDVPVKETAFISDQTLCDLIDPRNLNSENLQDIYQMRDDDFAEPEELEVWYMCNGQPQKELVFIDPLHSRERPRICVSIKAVQAMHRAIAVLSRKLDNVLVTLRTSREHYYKELTLLRELLYKQHADFTKGQMPSEHLAFYFKPENYQDEVTIQLFREQLAATTADLQNQIDIRDAEIRKLKKVLGRMARDDDGIERLHAAWDDEMIKALQERLDLKEAEAKSKAAHAAWLEASCATYEEELQRLRKVIDEMTAEQKSAEERERFRQEEEEKAREALLELEAQHARVKSMLEQERQARIRALRSLRSAGTVGRMPSNASTDGEQTLSKAPSEEFTLKDALADLEAEESTAAKAVAEDADAAAAAEAEKRLKVYKDLEMKRVASLASKRIGRLRQKLAPEDAVPQSRGTQTDDGDGAGSSTTPLSSPRSTPTVSYILMDTGLPAPSSPRASQEDEAAGPDGEEAAKSSRPRPEELTVAIPDGPQTLHEKILALAAEMIEEDLRGVVDALLAMLPPAGGDEDAELKSPRPFTANPAVNMPTEQPFAHSRWSLPPRTPRLRKSIVGGAGFSFQGAVKGKPATASTSAGGQSDLAKTAGSDMPWPSSPIRGRSRAASKVVLPASPRLEEALGDQRLGVRRRLHRSMTLVGGKDLPDVEDEDAPARRRTHSQEVDRTAALLLAQSRPMTPASSSSTSSSSDSSSRTTPDASFTRGRSTSFSKRLERPMQRRTYAGQHLQRSRSHGAFWSAPMGDEEEGGIAGLARLSALLPGLPVGHVEAALDLIGAGWVLKHPSGTSYQCSTAAVVAPSATESAPDPVGRPSVSAREPSPGGNPREEPDESSSSSSGSSVQEEASEKRRPISGSSTREEAGERRRPASVKSAPTTPGGAMRPPSAGDALTTTVAEDVEFSSSARASRVRQGAAPPPKLSVRTPVVVRESIQGKEITFQSQDRGASRGGGSVHLGVSSRWHQFMTEGRTGTSFAKADAQRRSMIPKEEVGPAMLLGQGLGSVAGLPFLPRTQTEIIVKPPVSRAAVRRRTVTVIAGEHSDEQHGPSPLVDDGTGLRRSTLPAGRARSQSVALQPKDVARLSESAAAALQSPFPYVRARRRSQPAIPSAAALESRRRQEPQSSGEQPQPWLTELPSVQTHEPPPPLWPTHRISGASQDASREASSGPHSERLQRLQSLSVQPMLTNQELMGRASRPSVPLRRHSVGAGDSHRLALEVEGLVGHGMAGRLQPTPVSPASLGSPVPPTPPEAAPRRARNWSMQKPLAGISIDPEGPPAQAVETADASTQTMLAVSDRFEVSTDRGVGTVGPLAPLLEQLEMRVADELLGFCKAFCEGAGLLVGLYQPADEPKSPDARQGFVSRMSASLRRLGGGASVVKAPAEQLALVIGDDVQEPSAGRRGTLHRGSLPRSTEPLKGFGDILPQEEFNRRSSKRDRLPKGVLLSGEALNCRLFGPASAPGGDTSLGAVVLPFVEHELQAGFDSEQGSMLADAESRLHIESSATLSTVASSSSLARLVPQQPDVILGTGFVPRIPPSVSRRDSIDYDEEVHDYKEVAPFSTKLLVAPHRSGIVHAQQEPLPLASRRRMMDDLLAAAAEDASLQEVDEEALIEQSKEWLLHDSRRHGGGRPTSSRQKVPQKPPEPPPGRANRRWFPAAASGGKSSLPAQAILMKGRGASADRARPEPPEGSGL